MVLTANGETLSQMNLIRFKLACPEALAPSLLCCHGTPSTPWCRRGGNPPEDLSLRSTHTLRQTLSLSNDMLFGVCYSEDPQMGHRSEREKARRAH